MDENEFKNRTKQVALRIIRLFEALPNTVTAQVIGKQLLRSATSIGAIIELPVAGNQPPTFYINSQLSKKKQTKVYIGWSF